LFACLVQGDLHADFFWQSWPEGPKKTDPSYCGWPKVAYDSSVIGGMAAKKPNGKLLTWKKGADHSKWGIADDTHDASKWVCVADMNRATTQWQRGGGALCFVQPELHATLQASVATYDSCSVNNADVAECMTASTPHAGVCDNWRAEQGVD